MSSFNRVVIVGHVTRDIDLKHTQSGTAVCDLGVAVNDRVKKNETWVDETTFVDCTVWGRNAETSAQFLRKGSQVLVEGRLKMDEWETDGQKRSKMRVSADRVVFLGSKSDAPAVDAPADLAW